LERYKVALLVLWHLDLTPARPFLKQGYAPNPRGGDPWEPVTLLRSLLLAILVGQPKLNPWAADLKASRVLAMLGGVLMDPKGKAGRRPGVGTFYDFKNRLHDGPSRRPCPHGLRPSLAERRRAAAPRALRQGRPGARLRRRRKERRDKSPAESPATTCQGVTGQLISVLKETQTQPNPNDLLGRLSRILLEVAVKVSAERGLLGDPQALLVCGDGSALPTGANRHGKRVCACPKLATCHCPRLLSDPDADIGYDSHRETYFFGHHLYEYVVSTKGHDLPVALRLDPASTSDFVAAPQSIEHLRKRLRDHTDMKLAAAIFDAGHDGKPIYAFLNHHDITPVIPLKQPAPAAHPRRSDIPLSRRGVPLCPAGVEMIRRGSNRKGGQIFGCPVRANKLARCPRAPEGATGFSCRPVTQLGHSVVIQATDDERLFPPIPRNHPQHRKLMNLRSGCERSFSVKKQRFKLLEARHRRASFWLIRTHLMAVLQHALAWVAKEDADGLVGQLLGRPQTSAAA
jgi:hypothetical protein